ncbi:MAG: DUF5671 domain-containing protein [Dehalococcoidia bacterium]
MPGYVIPIMVMALVAVGIGGVVFVIFRLRTGQGLNISWRSLFLVYFYLMTVISLLVMVGGLSNLVRAGMGVALGKEFSYHASRYMVKAPPPPVRVGERVPTPEEPEEPTPEEQEAERQKGLDRSFQEGLLNGLSFTIVGGIIWGAHLYGRRRLEREQEEGEWLHRLYVIALLLTFGILTLTSLPQAVFDTLRYYIIEQAPEFYGPPGDRLSTGIVALPLWLYYLWGTFRLVRGRAEGA